MTAPVRFAAPAAVDPDPPMCCGGWVGPGGERSMCYPDCYPVRFAAPAVVPDDPAGDALGVLAGAFGPVDILGGMPFVAPAVVEVPEPASTVPAEADGLAGTLALFAAGPTLTPADLADTTVLPVPPYGNLPSALLAAAAPEMAALDAANPVKQIAGLVTVVEPQPPATGGMVEALTAARDLMTTPAPYLDTLLSTPREEPARVEQPTPAAVAKGMTIAAPADPRGMPKLAAAIRDELVNAVREYCANDPRSLQVDIGPSEIGHECDSYVIRRALGFPGVAQPDPWASFVGTAVHAKLADVFDACNRALGREHYLIERKVYVTDGIYGSCDLFRDGIVIDHKIVGVDSMRAIKKGWSEIPKYHKQVNEYGVGWVRAGYEVTHVAIAAWPRSGFLDGLHVLTDEFRPELAEQALERLAGLVQLAVETNLDESDEHWPDVPTAPGKACGFCVYYDPIMSHQGRVSAGLPPVPDRKACPMGREYQSDRSRGTGRGKGRLTP